MAEFRLTPPRDPGAMGALYGAQDEMPAWLQAGMMNVPRGVRPTVPIDLQQSEPGAAAAYRMQQAVRPDFGRPGEGPSVRSIFNSTPVGAMANMAAQVEPFLPADSSSPIALMKSSTKIAGDRIAELLSSSVSPANAEEGKFSEPEPKRPSDIQSQIDKINKDISPQQTKLDRLKARFEGKQIDKDYYNSQRVALESQIERSKGQVKEIDAPFQRQLTDWETRRSSALTAEATASREIEQKKANAELPFRIKHPDATSAIVGGGNALTGITALATGLLSRGKIKPTLGVTGVGGLEGAITSNIPEWLDLAGGQPIGGPGWQKTRDQQLSLDNLIKTGSEAGVHASGAGAISYGSSFGPKIAARLGEYGSKIRGAFSGGRVPPEAPMSPPPSMEELLSGPNGGNPMQSAPSMPPIPQGMPGMMSAPSSLPMPEPSPPPSRAKRTRAAPPTIEPVLTPAGWFDPVTGRMLPGSISGPNPPVIR